MKLFAAIALACLLGTTLAARGNDADSFESEEVSYGDWHFTGCYTAQSQYEKCRYLYRNGAYCKSEWLGRNYECLRYEETHPYACYCK